MDLSERHFRVRHGGPIDRTGRAQHLACGQPHSTRLENFVHMVNSSPGNLGFRVVWRRSGYIDRTMEDRHCENAVARMIGYRTYNRCLSATPLKILMILIKTLPGEEEETKKLECFRNLEIHLGAVAGITWYASPVTHSASSTKKVWAPDSKLVAKGDRSISIPVMISMTLRQLQRGTRYVG